LKNLVGIPLALEASLLLDTRKILMNIICRARFGLLAVISLVGVLVGAALPAPAFADLIYTLNYDGCSGGCGNGQGTTNNNFGTVDLAQVNSNTVSVTVTLAESVALDVDFVNTGNGSNHEPFAFNVASPPGPVTIVAGSLTGGTCTGACFQVGPINDDISGLGTFTNTIACTSACPSGASGQDILGGTLMFSTTDGTALSVNDFIANGSGFVFAADVIDSVTGKTGEVGAQPDAPNPVPEPNTLAILGTMLVSLGGIGYAMRQRRENDL
jgi:hypothetical protein